MSTGNVFKSDLFYLNGIIQASMLAYPKQLMIETLRDAFSKDSYYHYVRDQWGFPNIPDHTDLPSDAGMNDDVTSRLFIGQAFRYDKAYIPAIIVKSGGFRYVPISMSRNEGFVQYRDTRVLDGYGNETLIATPANFVTSGAYEGSLILDIITGDLAARDELTEIVSILLTEVYLKQFINSGVFMKPINIGSPSEVDDNNEKFYKLSITCDIRTEWRREIPIDTVVDAINLCVDFGNLEVDTPVLAPNIEINSLINVIDSL